MSSNARYNLGRILVALTVSLFTLCILIPFLYDVAGVRKNLEDFFAPTLISQIKRKTRVPATPTATWTIPAVTPTALPTEIPNTPLPTVPSVNGVPIQKLAFLSDSTRAHIRDIYALGQTLGRNP